VILHRIVLTDPPTLADFTSDESMGLPPADDDPSRLRLRSGISVYATENQARRKALDYPRLGEHIAVLDVPNLGPLRFERTTRSRGHYTLWGDPDEIHRCVVAVRLARERG
jgi:hypothetical protein